MTKKTGKYGPSIKLNLPDRKWPDNRISSAPVWCSVDLRDGNQALPAPMGVDEKTGLFRLLCEIGFKEIEVGYPSSSATEYNFVSNLIEEDLIPEDVTIQVITQTRPDLISRTFNALEGAKRAIINFYTPTSPAQREFVLSKNRKEIIEMAVKGAELIRLETERLQDAGIRHLFCPESFSSTEPDFALEICESVLDVLEPTVDTKVILNLPATVEVSMPNVYADRIEWFSRNIKHRDRVIIGVHTHNDRGTAVAATELSLLAGADRVEGTLFGMGERAGNADLVTLSLNLFSQGVDPRLDLSKLNRIKEVFERCSGTSVYERHPYAGELVFTNFAGAHQDAIRKALKTPSGSKRDSWDVPYMLIDPSDIGRSDEHLIRINSQSGKGGIAFILDRYCNITLRDGDYAEIRDIIKKISEVSRKEIHPETIQELALAFSS